MYNISSSRITTLYDLVSVAQEIIADYGNLPIFVRDDSPGIGCEVPVLYITVKPPAIGEDEPMVPLRVVIK